MLRFSKEQRVLLVEKLPDLAQVAVGALVFGQFLGERPFLYTVAAAGYVVWYCPDVVRTLSCWREVRSMELNLFILLGMPTLTVAGVVFLDWRTRRHDRRTHRVGKS